ncbi:MULTISPECIES: S8 family serine peptidase [Haloferax]|uniref:S8 family serine peptidase n=1 Tax=Haloferax marinum TaxID=2666143 RepID=A0A6A8GB00_9EURY|nr:MULTISPECIES: S8 family serine peptidase [Haloferax]KAB1198696.1 S8 family serine peptidase [Haloferax sp. CBA1150]MRW97812.1 S8 family serine peptidase [Haloferax marinum]
MGDYSFSRRSFLLGCGVGLGTLAGGTGTALGQSGGRYIVGTNTPRATRAAKQAANAVHRELDFGTLGNAVAGTFTEAALQGLRKNPHVRYIEADGTMHAISIDSADPEVPWGVDRVDAEKAHSGGATGAGAHVAIIDSGIDSDHPDLRGNLGAGKAFVSARGPYAKPWDDDNGHGTHCAGTADAVDNGTGVVGVSTQATLHAVKVLDKNGSGQYSDVAAGIKYVADQGWDVASLSLGGPTSRTIEDACQYAFDRDVLLVAAAGNDGVNVKDSAPATYDTVMAISATDDRDRLASWSNYGADIELAAPGVNIYSTYPGGYRTFSGTSMACPHVSGACSQLIAQGYTPAEARQRLKDTAEDIGLPSSQQGAGLLDVEAAVSGSVDASPSVSWASPSGGETVSGTATLDIAAGDTEDSSGSLTVEWRVDGGDWNPTSYGSESGYYEASWDTTLLSDGDHTLDARATDSATNSSTATVTVTTENTDNAPTVSWESPTANETVSETSTLRIGASDDRATTDSLVVEYELDGSGTWLPTSYNSSTGFHEAEWDTTAVEDGSHTLAARATDGSGNTSTVAEISVDVDNTSTGPSGTIFEADITQANSRNPHAEFSIPWGATDSDGNLGSIELTLTQTAPSTDREDSVTIDVSGGSASGTTTLTAKHDSGSGNTYDVTISVSDTTGKTGGETVSITETGV